MDLLFFAAFLAVSIAFYAVGRLFENRLFVFAGAVVLMILGMPTWQGLSYQQFGNYSSSLNTTNFYSAVNVTTTTYNATSFSGNSTVLKYNLANSTTVSLDAANWKTVEIQPHDLSVGLGLVLVLIGLGTILLLAYQLYSDRWQRGESL